MIPPSLVDAFAATTAGHTPHNDPSPSLWPSAKDCVKQMLMCGAYGANPAQQSMMWTSGHLLHGSGFTEQVLARQKYRFWERTTMYKLIELSFPYMTFGEACREHFTTKGALASSKPVPTNRAESRSTSARRTDLHNSLRDMLLTMEQLRQRFRP
jgi:hypothetical protein